MCVCVSVCGDVVQVEISKHAMCVCVCVCHSTIQPS